MVRFADGCTGASASGPASKPEIPKPSNLWRYLQVAERSGVFGAGAIDAVKGRSELAVVWLEHLLLLSLLQHVSGS